jgi:hypothetical protein
MPIPIGADSKRNIAIPLRLLSRSNVVTRYASSISLFVTKNNSLAE